MKIPSYGAADKSYMLRGQQKWPMLPRRNLYLQVSGSASQMFQV